MQHNVSLNCTSITPYCTVENTIYGYFPSLPVNAFFVAFFSIAALLHMFLGFRYKTYFFAGALIFGTLAEAIGYAGRIVMHSNPYSSLGFRIQISCLIFAPSFVAAGVYITLKHIVLTFGTSKSRLPAKNYTWIFITCDFVSLMLQAVGGGIAGGAGNDEKLRDKGTNSMISGIVFQVFTLIVFGALALDYIIRTRLSWDQVPEDAKLLLSKRPFRFFAMGVVVAYVTIFCRCLYRIAEMVGGWANPIMRDEVGFVIMEGFMIVLAVLALTLFHPGYCFPALSKQRPNKGMVECKEDGNVLREESDK